MFFSVGMTPIESREWQLRFAKSYARSGQKLVEYCTPENAIAARSSFARTSDDDGGKAVTAVTTELMFDLCNYGDLIFDMFLFTNCNLCSCLSTIIND